MKIRVEDFEEFFLERIKHQFKVNEDFIVFAKSIIELFYPFQIDIDKINDKWNYKSEILEVLLELCRVFQIKTQMKDIKELQALVAKYGFLKNGSGTSSDIIFVLRNYVNANTILVRDKYPATVLITVDNLAETEKLKDMAEFAPGGVELKITISDGDTQVFPDGGNNNIAQSLLSGDTQSYLELMDGNIILTNNFTTYDL
jgi:hypothetical protein